MQIINRRSLLRAFSAAPLVATPSLAMPAAVEAAAAETKGPVFPRYVAFLAHEHRAALYALHRHVYEGDPNPLLPLFWLPQDQDVSLLVGGPKTPEQRARQVLQAVGLPAS
ncbi:MAG TPA: hypothetical protein VGN97_01810 [Mesorhizobium sp.]|nr:hypothetical protein [Mesorhizobium sp.]